jgi:hypothetical protein
VTKAAVGFRVHTGWAAAVVLSGPADAPRVVERRRVNLLAPGVPFECYHAAAAMPFAKAEAMLEKARSTATELAREALRDIAAGLRATKDELVAAGVVVSNARPLLSIEAALSSHAMKHAAEGQLYQQALMDAASELGLRVSAVPERDLPAIAGRTLGVSPLQLRSRTADLGRELGAPWAADQKAAALVAWLALASKAPNRGAGRK